jgi:PAS domain S-box-containing protein
MISILYVDDEATLLEVTREYLERTGEFTVVTCTSAQEAIGKLSECSFDAVVSDYQMPVMDGLAFLHHLRQEKNGIPFILFTGKGREEVAIEALNSGADFYLQKGGEPKSQYAELGNKIRQAVQRRKAERALLESEEKYRDLVENINDVLFIIDQERRISYISPRISQFGFTADALTGTVFSGIVTPEDISGVEEHFQAIDNGELYPFDFRIIDGAGETRTVRASGRLVFAGEKSSGIHGVMMDLTWVKAAEAKISESEQRYRNVFEAAGDAMLVVDQESGDIQDANRAATYLFGYTAGELKTMNHAELLACPDLPGGEARTGIFGPHLKYYRSREGTIFPADILSSEYPQKNRTITIHSIRNISEEICAEEQVLAARRFYAVLSQINQTIVRTKDLPALLADICRISVEYGNFRMSWVGLLDRDSMALRPVAHAGLEDGYLVLLDSAGDEEDKCGSPISIAIRKEQYEICNNIETDPRMEPWREEALSRGYRSFGAFPFSLRGEVVGVYLVYASQKNFFDASGIALLEEIARDISFALDLLDEQARRTRAEQALAGSEERAGFLAEILESSSQPFGVAYPGGGFGIVNPALCDLLGYTEPELRSMNWLEITPHEYHEREREALANLARSGTPVRYEKEYLRKDGTRVPVEVFAHRVPDDAGNIRFYYGFVTDISKRLRAQDLIKTERDRAKQYLDTVGVLVASVDSSGIITLINRKGCEVLGYTSEELIGQNWLDTCLPERVRDDVRQVLAQVVRGDAEPVAYHENTVLTKSGEERVFAFHNCIFQAGESLATGILFSGEDITPRKKLEDELRESEERFGNLIRNSPDMIRIIDKNGRIAFSSPSTLRITGYDPADLPGRDPFEYVHPDDRDRVKTAFAEVIGNTHAGIPTEYRIRHADGHYIEVEAVGVNLLEVPGICGIVTSVRPITVRKTAERALQEREGRYRALFERSMDAILVFTDRIVDCNPAAERLFGYGRKEILGRTPEFLSPAKQPGGTASAPLAEVYMQKAREGIVPGFRWTHQTKDGRLFPADVTIIPSRVGEDEQLIAIVHDRTVQDQQEGQSRQLARFVEDNPDPVIEFDERCEITYANPAVFAALKHLGVLPDPAAFIPEDFDVLVHGLKAEGSSPVNRDVRIGTALFGETLFYDHGDKRIRIFAREITARSFEIHALSQANRKLNLLSSITRHDIKNKLTGVLGYLELAKGSTRDPDLIEYVTRAETSATAIRLQIEFTKEYENLGVKTPLWQNVSGVLESAQKLLGPGKVAVDNEVDGLAVYADPMFEKVLYCLLENAVRHGDTITRIRICGSPVPTGYLLAVEDDGVGIPKEKKEKIFNKNVEKAGGGLGLFLTREILSITGITIEETGTPGSGARFEMSIPPGKFQGKCPASPGPQ